MCGWVFESTESRVRCRAVVNTEESWSSLKAGNFLTGALSF